MDTLDHCSRFSADGKTPCSGIVYELTIHIPPVPECGHYDTYPPGTQDICDSHMQSFLDMQSILYFTVTSRKPIDTIRIPTEGTVQREQEK